MPTRHPFPQAMRIAGDLYGHVLDRNSDKDGFHYVLDCLVKGKKSVRQLAVEMVLSEEFERNFVTGRDSRSVVILLHRILMGHDLAPPQVKSEIVKYQRFGLEDYIAQLTHSARYLDMYGDDRVPGKGHRSRPSHAPNPEHA